MVAANRNEGKKIITEVNLMPMAAVIVVLLIIFMVASATPFHHGSGVDLVKVENPVAMPDAAKEDALTVTVLRDGVIFFGSDRIAPNQLAAKVKEQLAGRSNQRVFLSADAHAQYGAVSEVVDGVRATGVRDLGVLTEKRYMSPLPPPAELLKN